MRLTIARVVLLAAGYSALSAQTAIGREGGDVPEKEALTLNANNWRLITDSVMGGVSRGRFERTVRAGRPAVCLSGRVSTENDGGFIQIAVDLPSAWAPKLPRYSGVRLSVFGNGEDYNLHLRTGDLWLPWQSYRSSFESAPRWQTVDLPFADFVPYKTGRALRVDRLQRLGVVAIGRPFDADICVGPVAFYRAG